MSWAWGCLETDSTFSVHIKLLLEMGALNFLLKKRETESEVLYYKKIPVPIAFSPPPIPIATAGALQTIVGNAKHCHNNT